MPERLSNQISEIGNNTLRLSRGLFFIGVSYGAPVVRMIQPHLSRFVQDETGIQIGPDWFLAKEKAD